MPAITVENVSKKYRKGQIGYRTLREDLYDLTGRLISLTGKGRAHSYKEHVWALKDVSFQVEQGEKLGIIGPNGSGKTTLLRLLAGITKPTEGSISLKGRLGVLIEIMAGFHPELTGRENIYLNGAIMGMSRKEIRRKFDEIVSFAEVEDFVDTPIKRYSSGMHVRLGFAVAAHLDPDILLVDEVLAVGDAAFQRKCLGKMDEAAGEGRTVVFVSHNMGSIRSLCERCIWFESGELRMDGEPAQVVSQYLTSRLADDTRGEVCWADPADAPGGDELKLQSIRLLGPTGEVQSAFEADKPIRIEITYCVMQPLRGMRINMRLVTQDGVTVFVSADHLAREDTVQRGLYRSTCEIPDCLLNQGTYLLRVGSDSPGVKVFVPGREFLSFSVVGATLHGLPLPENWPGVVAPQLKWTTEQVNQA